MTYRSPTDNRSDNGPAWQIQSVNVTTRWAALMKARNKVWNGGRGEFGKREDFILEAGSVALLREVGLGARMDREGHPHDGSAIAWEGRPRSSSTPTNSPASA